MNISLIFPPYFPSDVPYLSLPTLAAYIDHDVVCHDINLELWDIFLSEEFLSSTLRKDQEDLVYRAEKAKKILRSEEAYDIFRYIEAVTSVEAVWKALSEEFPAKISWREYQVEPQLQEMEFLVAKMKKEPIDMFYEPFEKYCLNSIVKGQPDIIGFSIVLPQQVIPSMEMAQIIRKELPDTFIIFGGPYMTYLSVFDDIIQYFFSYCDCITLFEGEQSLAALCEYKDNNLALHEVPNIIYTSKLERTDYNILDITCVPLPQYDCLPLTSYFAPQLVLPYLTSRGCPWHKCLFCPLHFTYGNGFRQLPVERVVEDIKKLKSRYHLEYLSFVDLSLNPQYAFSLSEELLQQGISINMKANMRFEKHLDNSFFETLREAGFRVLSFGMESFNNRVLKMMNKGTDEETIKKTLKSSWESDIWNNIYFMTGFPTETEDEIRNTQQFITENARCMGVLDHTRFELYYPALHRCEVLPIDNVKRGQGIFGLAYNFTPKKGVTRERALELDLQVEIEIRKTIPHHWIAQTLSDDMVFLYVDRYGKDNLLEAAL
ncbi:MAG: B12-binding domain-containing radical SAM protein [Theionarchaea archaeon]|nr:B12-binding domain-containing radical SAM protein [Theionarchaea archaeon]